MAKRIAVDQLKPGQVLAEELTRQDGVLLAGRGAEVTEGLIRMLGRMNIDTVVIEEAEQRTEEDIRGEHEAELDRIARAFRRSGDSPVLGALRRTLVFMSELERDKALAFLELSRETEEPEGAEGSAGACGPGGEGAEGGGAEGAGTPEKRVSRLETADDAEPPKKRVSRLETADDAEPPKKRVSRLETVDGDKPPKKRVSRLETADDAGSPGKLATKLETKP
ncbi:MAG: hypothetical protein LBQ12_12625 [Deltaproteobacteria bacterium]|nr:hypothetical protein [Deltaproteobacteria bacterium]